MTSTPPGGEPSLVASILLAGHQAARALENRISGVSAGEAVLLGALHSGRLTMSGVVSTLHIKASTATSLVSRLAAAGYVERSRNPGDGRSLIVSITAAGEERWRLVAPAFAELAEALVDVAGVDAADGHRRIVDALAALDG